MRIVIILIMIIMAATACGRENSGFEKGTVPTSNETNFLDQLDIASLKNMIGDPNTLHPSAMLSHEAALKAADDYGARTGVWFEDENGFNLLTSYTSGETKAGNTVSAGISEVPKDRTVRFQLTSRDESGRRKTLIAQYMTSEGDPVYGRADFAPVLPGNSNVNYLLSIEMLSKDDVVEDTFLIPLYVPAHELNARLTVDAATEDSNVAKLTLYNAGSTSLFFGKDYSLYRKDGTEWKPVPDDRAVIAIGINTGPGGTYEEMITFPGQMMPGHYRLVKRIEGFMTDLSVSLAADFELH